MFYLMAPPSKIQIVNVFFKTHIVLKQTFVLFNNAI